MYFSKILRDQIHLSTRWGEDFMSSTPSTQISGKNWKISSTRGAQGPHFSVSDLDQHYRGSSRRVGDPMSVIAGSAKHCTKVVRYAFWYKNTIKTPSWDLISEK
jgi:hypothetical protein